MNLGTTKSLIGCFLYVTGGKMRDILRHGLRKGWIFCVMGNLGEGAGWVPLTSSVVCAFFFFLPYFSFVRSLQSLPLLGVLKNGAFLSRQAARPAMTRANCAAPCKYDCLVPLVCAILPFVLSRARTENPQRRWRKACVFRVRQGRMST
jgi:hypothetical protein